MALFEDISIHGIPQIFDTNTSIFKRILFLILLLLSFAGSSFFIYLTISHYLDNPVYTRSYVEVETEEAQIEWPDLVIRFDIKSAGDNPETKSANAFKKMWPEYKNKMKLKFDNNARTGTAQQKLAVQ